MSDEAIPPRVRQFITEHVDSVMQLEILLLLAGQAGNLWTAPDLARQLRIDPVWVEGQLRAMAAGGLVTIADGSPTQFRYGPRTPDLAATVQEVAQAYVDRRVTIIGLIFAKPTEKIRSFADAFRIRKDRSD